MDVPDQELVRAAGAGDDGAFHALVDRHAKTLFRAALALAPDRDQAEDVLQETLVAAYRGLKSFQGRSSLKTWLLTILSRCAHKSRRRSARWRGTLSIHGDEGARVLESRNPDGGGRSAMLGVERRLDVMEVLKSLSQAHREVLMLREIQGLSYEEISQVLSVPRGTVESRLFRARAAFREVFGSEA